MNTRWLYNNKTILATAITAALVSGCGGGEDSTDTKDPAPSTSFTVTALDGYLHKASVSIDGDGDGVCETSVGLTDDKGQLKISGAHKGKAVCVSATAGTTIDMTRGLVAENFTLKAPAGSEVVNPLSSLVVEKLAKDDTLTLALAQKAVVDAIVESGIQINEADAFGDYLAPSNSPEDTLKSKQLEVIGEVLVDNHNKTNITPEAKLAIIEQVAGEVHDKTTNDLDNFNPIVGDISDDGILPPLTVNHRPVSIGAINLGATTEASDGTSTIRLITTYEMKFKDSDAGDTFTYKVAVDSEHQNGVKISDDGVLSGVKVDKAGVFKFYISAVDNHGAKSNPVEFTLTLTSANAAPTIDPTAKAALEETIKALDFTKGVEFPSQTISLDGLFIDEDVASLTIHTHLDGFGLTSSIVDRQLVISGTPTVDGEVNIAIWAEDGVNQAQASTTIFFTIKPSDVVVTHPLENHTFYNIDNQSISEHPQLTCNGVEFKNGLVYFSPKQSEHIYACIEPTEQVGTYQVNGDTLRTTVTEENKTVIDDFIILKPIDAFTNNGYFVRATSVAGQNTGGPAVWLTNFFDNTKHANLALNMESGNSLYRYFVWKNDQYINGDVGIKLNGRSNLNEQPIAAVSFSSALTCADLETIYGSFYLSNENRSTAITTLCQDISNGEPVVTFNNLNGTGDDNLIDGKYYTITSDLTADYQNKMAPLAMRVKYIATKACNTSDDAVNQNDIPTSLTTPEQYQQAISECKSNSATVTNVESVLTNFVRTLASKSFSLRSSQDNYVFYENNLGERSVRIEELNSSDKNDDTVTKQLVATAKWKYENGDIVIFEAKDPANNNAMNVKETIALTSWSYDEKSLALKKLFQSDEYDQHQLGDWQTHGKMSSIVYSLKSVSH